MMPNLKRCIPQVAASKRRLAKGLGAAVLEVSPGSNGGVEASPAIGRN